MDLREYLEGTPVKMLRQSRVLVVNHLGILTGFVVDEVLGLKHFHDEDYSDDMCVENPSISGYVEHGFIKDGERWCVFNVHKLADSVRFVQAAG
jgi:twitching motility protein PilI